jgi:SAM-dependent methyltransferase
MDAEGMTFDELKRFADTVGERRGWDFSRVRDARDPVPWDYEDVVRRYLRPTDRVLDIGTGGGERFLALAPEFGFGVGIDAEPAQIQAALENRPPALAGRVQFELMDARDLRYADGSFDLVLNRHASVYPDEIVRVLRQGGYLLTQQVGAENTRNICSLFGCGPGGTYEQEPLQDMPALVEAFTRLSCAIRARAEYDVGYYFLDVTSLIFWLKAIPIPEDFAIEVHWQQVAQIIQAYHTPRGIETNEQRELLVVQKGSGA